MKLFIEKSGEEKEIQIGEKKIKEILKEYNITTSSVIIVKNSQLAFEDDIVTDEDSLELLSVVSGG